MSLKLNLMANIGRYLSIIPPRDIVEMLGHGLR